MLSTPRLFGMMRFTMGLKPKRCKNQRTATIVFLQNTWIPPPLGRSSYRPHLRHHLGPTVKNGTCFQNDMPRIRSLRRIWTLIESIALQALLVPKHNRKWYINAKMTSIYQLICLDHHGPFESCWQKLRWQWLSNMPCWTRAASNGHVIFLPRLWYRST